MMTVKRQAIVHMRDRSFVVRGLVSLDGRSHHVSVIEQYGPTLLDSRRPPVVRTHDDIELITLALVAAEDWSVTATELSELQAAFAYVCEVKT